METNKKVENSSIKYKRFTEKDFPTFEKMTNDQLQAILRADIEGHSQSAEVILYIMKLLADRTPSTPHEVFIENAMNEYYRYNRT